MTKFLPVLIILLGLNLSADYVKHTAVGCASPETIQRIDGKKATLDASELELWLMKNNCKVIDKKTLIEVLDYSGKKQMNLKLKLKKTGEILYSQSKAIQIEQPGQKNIIHKF